MCVLILNCRALSVVARCLLVVVCCVVVHGCRWFCVVVVCGLLSFVVGVRVSRVVDC